ncbi:MAG: heme exporter protein CcmD [Alphaproteobacteria bacterium]|nr:heme exporter protein CcmD [Alphaproteobacteria bacterium]
MSFWEMGGYAVYVWPAFGAAAVILIALLAISLRTLRARERALRVLEKTRATAGSERGERKA